MLFGAGEFEWINANTFVLGAIIGVCTGYLQMMISRAVHNSEQRVLREVAKDYARSDTTQLIVKDLQRRASVLFKKMESVEDRLVDLERGRHAD